LAGADDIQKNLQRRGLTGETWFPPCSTSQDWRVAVEEGATLVRLGSSLFRD